MSTAGPNAPGTMADDATVGTITWVNPNNAKVSDSVYTTASTLISNTASHYLKATNFGFSIPAGATINGITVKVKRNGTQNDTDILDNSVKIVQGGSIGGTEKKIAGAWPTSDATQTYGGVADLWGLTWAPSDINASTFGVVLSVRGEASASNEIGSVDFMSITITYTGGAVTNSGVAIFFQ